VIVTSSSDEKLARAAELGADHGVNYVSEPDWDRVVREKTGGRGVDLVVEVGGGGTMARSLAAVRVAGTVAVIGVLAGRTTELDLAPLLMRRVRLQGVIVGSRADFEAMARGFDAHRIRPLVDRVFRFENAVAAFRHMEAGRHMGKVVVAVGT
jgi:NADPH:quinone reductase-like Zn-dependent oxidoreductase